MNNFFARVVLLGAALGCSTQTVQANLTGHWTFDSETNVGAASVSDDLIASGNATYTASGKLGGAVQFQGAGDYLAKTGGALPEGLPVGDSSFTIGLWMKFDSSADPDNTGYGMIGWGAYGTANKVNAFRTGNKGEIGSTYRDSGEGTVPTDFDYGIGHYSWGGYPDIFRGADGQGARPDIDDGAWHFLAVTYDAKGDAQGIKTLFADAVQLGASRSGIGNLDVTSANFRIGCTNNTEWFLGLLDDVAVWNRPLSSGELKSVYDLAASATYGFNAGEADLLLTAHAAQSHTSVFIRDSEWVYKAEVTGDAGLSADGQTLVIDAAAGTGMVLVPEPTALSLFLIVTGVLVVRRRLLRM